MLVKVLDKSEKSCLAKIFQIQMSAYRIEADILEVRTLPPLQESIEDLNSSNEEILIYIVDESPQGAIFLDREKDSITINKLVVDPKEFRNGIGRALVKHSIGLYLGLKFKVQTGKKNAPAINLYFSLGFKIVKERMDEDGLVIVELERASI
jgi:ribosomal protein S18 acetylase RimI-like enzyme